MSKKFANNWQSRKAVASFVWRIFSRWVKYSCIIQCSAAFVYTSAVCKCCFQLFLSIFLDFQRICWISLRVHTLEVAVNVMFYRPGALSSDFKSVTTLKIFPAWDIIIFPVCFVNEHLLQKIVHLFQISENVYETV